MRLIFACLLIVFTLPAAAQERLTCRGKQGFDLGGDAKGCIAAISRGSITTTTTRDDGASSSVRRKSHPIVVGLMSGSASEKRNVTKAQMLAMCNLALNDVRQAFASEKFVRIILVMDWRAAGGPRQAGYSNGRCKGFRFFNG